MRTNFISLTVSVIFIGFLCIAFTNSAVAARWERIEDMPTPRWGLSSSVVDGRIYVFGGAKSGKPFPQWHPSGYLASVEVYDPATDTWEKKDDMSAAKAWLSTSVVNGKIYVIGGGTTTEIVPPTVEEYNPATDTWTQKTDMPEPTTGLSTCVVHGKIYAIGGISEDMNSTPSMFEYDPAADTWIQKSDMPAPRNMLAACAMNGKIYAIGGQIPTELFFGLSSVFEYDPTTDTWTWKSNMLEPRMALGACAVNGKIYAVGGASNAALSTVEIYDPQADTWTKGVDLPSALTHMALGVVDGRIYSVGGRQTGFIALSTVEVYDTGFRGTENLQNLSSVSPQGKLAKTWGEIKRSR